MTTNHGRMIVAAKRKSKPVPDESQSADTDTHPGVRSPNDLPLWDIPVKNIEDENKKLIFSEIRYRRLFEAAQEGILILDAQTGKIEDANPFMEDLVGYPHAELVGKNLLEIGLFKDRSAIQLMYQQLIVNGYVQYEDLPLLTKTGGKREVGLVSNIYLVDHRRVIQCNIRDITALKEAEIIAKKAHDELVDTLAELQTHDIELRSLYKMNELLQSCNSQEEAFQVIRMLGSELFPKQKGCLAILRLPSQFLEVVVCWGNTDFFESSFMLDDCWALRRGQNHIVENPQTGMICHHFSKPIESGYICVPLMVQGEILGMVCITCPDEKHQQRQQQMAIIIGDAIKLSLSNLRLREKLSEQALTDQLTGLGNRRYLEDNMPRELARMLRLKTSVCVAMLDLDHFKNFNDMHGHDTGDMFLSKLGELLRENLRQSDIICRYGGEEFVIVLIDTSSEEIRVRLEKIQKMVKEIHIQKDKERIAGVTVSIGLVEAHDSDWNTSRLLREADEALYAAKRAGRDCIVVYPAKDKQPPTVEE
jgi:diguanylate cyclase (GGDEF)-like protein/PAS domain S-box-containing protein